MSLFTLNEYTEQKKFRPQKTVFSYKDDNDYKTKRNNLIRHNLGNTVGNRIITRDAKRTSRFTNDHLHRIGASSAKRNGEIALNMLKNFDPKEITPEARNVLNNSRTAKDLGMHVKSNFISEIKPHQNDLDALYQPLSHKHFGANTIGFNKNGTLVSNQNIDPHNKRLIRHSLLSHEIDHKKGFEHEISNHKGQKRKEVLNRLGKSQAFTGNMDTYKKLPAEISANKVQLNTNSLRDRAFNDPKHVKEREETFKKIEHDTRGRTVGSYHGLLKHDPNNTYDKTQQKMANLYTTTKRNVSDHEVPESIRNKFK